MSLQKRVSKLEQQLAPGADNKGEATIGAGTEHEMTVPLRLLPTLDEWCKGAEAQLADPALAPGEGMPEWEARAPAPVVEGYKKVVSERMRQAEEALALFEDDEDSPKTF